MTDDVIARAKAAQSVWNRSHAVEVDIVYGPNAVVDAYYAAPEIVDGLLAEVERQRAGREFERGMLVAGAAEIQDLGFKVEQLQAQQDEDRDEIHTLRRHLADEEAEVERLRGALDGLKAEWENAAEEEGGELGGPTAGAFYECAASIEAVLRGDQ